MATIDEVNELANVDLFLSEMDEESTSKMCHQASVWLAVQIKKNYIPDYNVYICTGLYRGLDHTWLMVEEDSIEYVIDMTVNQFIDCQVPYIGVLNKNYHIHNVMCLCDDADKLVEFVEALGA